MSGPYFPSWQPPWYLVPVVCGLIAAVVSALQWWPALAVLGGLALIILAPIEFAFALLAFAIPFDSVSQVGGTVTLSFLTTAIGGLILIGTALAGVRLQAMPKTASLFLLFFIWTAMSAFWAVDPELCIERLPSVAAIGALYLTAVSMRLSHAEFSWIRRVTVLGGSIASALALYQFTHGVTVASRATIVIGSASTNPNELAASLILPVSFAVGDVLSSHGVRRIVPLLQALVMLTCVVLTMSRGALAALMVMMVVYIWRKGINWRLIVLLACIAGGILIAPELLLTRVHQAISSRAQGRFDIWLVGAQVVRHHWLLGVGLDNFPYVFQRYAGYQVVFRAASEAAHNIYLQCLAETGLVGFLLLVAALRLQFKELRRVVQQADLRVAQIVVPCEAAAWALVTQAMSSNLLWRKVFWFDWIVVAAAIQASRYWRPEPSFIEESGKVDTRRVGVGILPSSATSKSYGTYS